MRTALCLCGIGLGLPWYGFIPSFNSKHTCARVTTTISKQQYHNQHGSHSYNQQKTAKRNSGRNDWIPSLQSVWCWCERYVAFTIKMLQSWRQRQCWEFLPGAAPPTQPPLPLLSSIIATSHTQNLQSIIKKQKKDGKDDSRSVAAATSRQRQHGNGNNNGDGGKDNDGAATNQGGGVGGHWSQRLPCGHHFEWWW